jgi:ABC-type methionine transport system ATPase subunit
MTTLDQIALQQRQDGALATASRQQTNPTDPQILLNVQKIMTTLERIALRQDTDENLCQKFEEVASQLEHSILQLTLDEKHNTQMIQDMLNNVSAAMSILHGKVDTIRMQSIQPTIIPDEPPNALPDTAVDELHLFPETDDPREARDQVREETVAAALELLLTML